MSQSRLAQQGRLERGTGAPAALPAVLLAAYLFVPAARHSRRHCCLGSN